MVGRKSEWGWGRTCIALALLTPPTSATQAQVTERNDDSRARSMAFVRGTGVASGETPAARWIDLVCPRVIGLRDEAARVVEARIRRIAIEAGARVAPDDCDSNLVVTFTSDAAGLTRTVHRLEPRRFSQVPPSRREALLNGPQHIRWWYSAETRGRNGEGERQPGTSGQGQADNHGTMDVSYAFEGDTMRYDSSLISTFSQRALVSASVVVDLDSIMGMNLNAVAAYAALVGLAEIRNPDFAPQGSILGLFNASNPPNSLTAQDRDFLRALYRLPMDREASRHRGGLVRDMSMASADD